MPPGNIIKSQARDFVLSLINYFECEKENGGPLLPLDAVNERVSNALGISLRSVYRIKEEGKLLEGTDENLKSPGKSRVYQKKKTTDLSELAKSHIRNTIYHMYEHHQHVTLNTLQNEFKREGTINISRTSLHRVLPSIGFSYKKDSNRRALMEKQSVISLRSTFLRKYRENSISSYKRQVVFLDETWVFAKGAKKSSWQDSSVRSVKKTDASEGKRFIVLHAGHSGGFVPNASLIYATKSKLADYHGDMDSKIFMKWLKEKLVPNLEEPSLIIMDNAPYHTVLVEKQPTSAWTKLAIKDWLQENHIPFDPHLFKQELLDLAKLHAKSSRYEADEFLREHGHECLRLPPYHCQFNAIELAWARAKTYYDTHIGEDGFGDDKVLSMWDKALALCTPEEWAKYIRHTEEEIEKWTNRQHLIDEIPELIIAVNNGDSSDFSEDDT